MSQSLPYGYWTYGGKDGLYGAESTLQEQPDGSIRIVKDPDYPAVLEDRYILWAVKNDKAALRSFFQRLPTMDPVSQTRLNDLVARYPAHFVVRQDSTTMSDNIQRKHVVQTRQDTTRNKYLEKPKKGGQSRNNTKPDAYPATTETVNEGASVSISIPTSIKYVTTVTGLPSGLVWNGVVVRGTAPSVSADGSYRITVTRTNSLGASIGYLTLTVRDTKPSAPTIDSVTTGNEEIIVAITPGDDGGDPITDYEYTVDGGLTYISIGSTTSPLTITGLENGTSYLVQIRPVNGGGPGDPSTPPFTATPSTTPGQPTVDSVTAGNAQAEITVTTADDGGDPITDYEYTTDGGLNWISIGSTVNPLVIAPLTNGVDYDIQVRPVNGNGAGTPSAPFSVTPSAGLPFAPTIDAITTGDEELTVAFTAGGDGGFPITDYEYTVDGVNFISAGTTTSPFTISGLTNGTSYPVQIRAVNTSGAGDPSAVVNATPSTTASKPTIDSVTTGDGELVVAVTPGDDGGDPVTDYEYTVDGGLNYISIGSAVSPLTISPLTNGVSYTVQVRPVNGNGAGEPSDPFGGTPSTVPGQPTISGITTGDQELTVSVTGDNGGSAITDYEYSLNGGPFISAGTAVSPFTISGLTNGVSYDVVVQAVNANGTGTPSAATTATPSTVPAQPTIVSITAGDEELTVAFTAGDDGGSALTDIEYTLDGTNYISAGTTTSPFTITGLTNGQTYPVQIRPVNANGTGTPSTVTNATPEGVPSTAPTIDSFSTGDGTVTINFTPGDDGGSAITDYEYTLDGGLNWVSASTAASPVVVSGLTNGTEYDIEIRPVNANGAGPASTTVTATPSTVPDAPTLDSLTVGDEQLTVAFTPGATGGSALTDIEYRVDGGAWVSAGTTVSPFVISGLTNGTSYDVEIRAVNANGSGAASNLLSATPATTPAAPTISGITTGDEQLTVAFTAGSDGGSAITDYEYSLDGGAFVSAGTTTSPFTIAGLNNGQTYSVVIRAVNAEGNGASSVADTGTPSTVPDAPTLNTLTSGSTELEAAFTLGGTGGSPITDVEYRLNSGAWVSFGSTTSPQTITGLTNGVAYTVEVRAVNANGASAASNSLTETPAASWEPTDVSVVAWVDASDTSSYTVSGSTLTAVTDKAGTYTLGIGGTPTRVTGGLNSLNVFDFDGTNEYIQSTAYRTQVSSGNHWAIGVFRPDVADGTKDSLWSYETGSTPKRDYAVSSGNTGSWPGELDLDALSSNRISSTIGNKQDWNLQSLTLGSWAIVVTYFNKTGNQIGCRKNGNNCFTPVNDYDNSLQTSQELRLMRNRASEELNGRLAEFFAVADLPGTGGTDLSDVEKAEGYLAWKWGLESLLPSGHPYKNSPP